MPASQVQNCEHKTYIQSNSIQTKSTNKPVAS